MAALTFLDVSHRFASDWVLLHIEGELPRGGRLLLTGDNGSGKTTLLRLCATALRPSAGALRVLDCPTDHASAAVRPLVALMSHQHHFYEALSASANLRLGLRLCRPQALTQVPDALRRVGLQAQASAPVATFSAGMKRRLALARLWLRRPALLLLDEPFAALDAAGIALLETMLDEWAQQKVSWAMASHETVRARRWATHTLHLSGPSSAVANAA